MSQDKQVYTEKDFEKALDKLKNMSKADAEAQGLNHIRERVLAGDLGNAGYLLITEDKIAGLLKS
ncbi:hypothetical protein [Shimazuella alba]|uniref:Uncharacterized protein n=1 Tax=Shimazuella alba TaxID=2690964 RepID=A0A6I4VR18_9BACL|nr:hypothetical protein [Shimazuella alba]MXQ52851.1 hypothetical protein [Shimazuella alba]